MNRQEDNIPLFKRLAAARRSMGIAQSALAREVGCAQAAVSMMENGKADAMSKETLLKIADVLHVEVDGDSVATSNANAIAGRAYCPNGDCPSNVPFLVGSELAFWPSGQPSSGSTHCAFCGEVLERACPSCGAPVGEGAFCGKCGARLVMPPASEILDAAGWVASRREEIATLRSLSGR